MAAPFLRKFFAASGPRAIHMFDPLRSLYLFEGHNRFHVERIYSGEFLRFIGNSFQVAQVFVSCFHPRWQVVFMGLRQVWLEKS